MALAAAPGCGFNTASGRPGADAGPGDDAPVGTGGSDAGNDGGTVDPPPGNAVCYGPSGWQVCVGARPTNAVPLSDTLDTDKSEQCLKKQPESWKNSPSSQPDACIVVAGSVVIDSLHVTGRRPLVIVADSAITVMTLLDVASHRAQHVVGAGTGSGEDCKPFAGDPGNGPPGGGGGGAGGSLRFAGGTGGTGNGVNQPGGLAADVVGGAPSHLQGGCAGQPGAGGKADDGGAGGGAVYLVSGGTISIPGRIDVSGAGGAGQSSLHGGGGGGSGGVIVLYAVGSINPMATTILIADGGGGGGGAAQSDPPIAPSEDGGEPVLALPIVAATGGTGALVAAEGRGGSGGAGYPAPSSGAAVPLILGGSGDQGAGGGGGGGGGGFILSNHAITSGGRMPDVTNWP
jgi:hypothetical protein